MKRDLRDGSVRGSRAAQQHFKMGFLPSPETPETDQMKMAISGDSQWQHVLFFFFVLKCAVPLTSPTRPEPVHKCSLEPGTMKEERESSARGRGPSSRFPS